MGSIPTPATEVIMQEGTKVRIKPEAWVKFCDRTKTYRPNPGVQTVFRMPANPPFDDRVMLDFPLYWWEESDLELVD